MRTMNCLDLARKLYKQISIFKYQLDQLIEVEKEELGFIEEADGARAWVEDGVLKIVVDDCLPVLKNYTTEMRDAWVGKIMKALSSIDIVFEKCFCTVITYAPRENHWDVDNKSYKPIIDSLRYSKKIKNDEYQYLTLMVVGTVDKEYPRTEIWASELPINELVFVSEIYEVFKKYIL